jgi:hypothetical protein
MEGGVLLSCCRGVVVSLRTARKLLPIPPGERQRQKKKEKKKEKEKEDRLEGVQEEHGKFLVVVGLLCQALRYAVCVEYDSQNDGIHVSLFTTETFAVPSLVMFAECCCL